MIHVLDFIYKSISKPLSLHWAMCWVQNISILKTTLCPLNLSFSLRNVLKMLWK